MTAQDGVENRSVPRSSLRPLLHAARCGGAALLLSCAGLAAGLPAADAPALEPCLDEAALPALVIERLNALRARGDAPCTSAAVTPRPLAWESRLAASAHEQAVDLALNDRLSHVDAMQRGFALRLQSTGYRAAKAGENLAGGQVSVDETLQDWLASPSHCANLMKPEFSEVGVACVQRRGTRYERFWVAHLGAPARR